MIKRIRFDELVDMIELIIRDARAEWERELQRSNQVAPQPDTEATPQ